MRLSTVLGSRVYEHEAGAHRKQAHFADLLSPWMTMEKCLSTQIGVLFCCELDTGLVG